MSTAKKFELAPDEVYIQEALKDGRAIIMEASMKALGTPDVTFQARVKHLDMDHVYRLRMIFDQEGRLVPVVIFRTDDPADLRMILADGFHRHEVYRREGLTSIRAYIITVPADHLEREARLFAAMSNQITLLSRTKQDERKATEILFADPECLQWTARRIGDHCGVSADSAQRWRDEYLARNQISIPSHVITSDGRKTPTQTSRTTGIPAISKRNDRPGFKATVCGKSIWGKTEAEVTAKIETIKASTIAKRSLLKSSSISDYLNRRKLFAECCSLRCTVGGSLSGVKTTDAVIVGAPETGADAILKAIAILRLLPHHTGQVDPRRIVACYTEDHPAVLLDLARKDGIEFLTPEELVESLKAEAE
jgi:hypothetical protein